MAITDNDSIQIIIVDNQSTQEDFDKLQLYCRDIRRVNVIRSNKNLGYFKGLNEGIAAVDKDQETTLIVGNNDLTFDPEFVQKLKQINYDTDVLVIAPNIITKDGRHQNPHVIDKVSLLERIKVRVYFSNYYVGQAFKFVNQSLKKVTHRHTFLQHTYGQMKIKRGIGACYILTPNFFHFFDRLDDRVFMWGEEALLSNQVESVKGCTLYDPTVKIIHHESATVSAIQSKQKYYIVKESYRIYGKYL